MTKPANTEAIEKSTHISWEKWLQYLERISAKDLTHKEIAAFIHKKLKGTTENDGWSAQSVTVAYEQHIGRRQPGQRNNGEFEVSANSTYTGTMDEAIAAWVELVKDRKDFAGIAIVKNPATTKTEKWRHWRYVLADGSHVAADSWQKTPEKAGLAITHTKLKSSEDAERWRAYWKELLKEV